MERLPFEGNREREKCPYCHEMLYYFDNGIDRVWKRVDHGTRNKGVVCSICYEPKPD